MENSIKNLMFDLAEGREIYDAEQERVIDKYEANDAVRKVCYDVLGINKNSSARDVTRALRRDAANELFEVIEEVVDKIVATGFHENEFFNDFVETKNLKDGDKNEFYADQDIILSVAKVSGDHHDLTIQRLGEGESFDVPTSTYAIKVGSDIRLFLTERRDWSQFINAVAKAYISAIQSDIYGEAMNAETRIPLPAQFKKSGALVKDTLDTLIEDVETANECPVMIMGTKTALKKLNALADVDWADEGSKKDMMTLGRLGSYETNVLMEIPQRFENNDTTKKLIDNKKLLIMPMVDNKFIKFVDGGETTLEVTEKGKTKDDMQTFEAQREMGVASVLTRLFGVWNLD